MGEVRSEGVAVEKWPKEPLRVGTSAAGLPALAIYPASQEVAAIVRSVVTGKIRASDAELSRQAGAFLQGDQPGWIEVEFWKPGPEDHQAFVDRVNQLIEIEQLKK